MIRATILAACIASAAAFAPSAGFAPRSAMRSTRAGGFHIQITAQHASIVWAGTNEICDDISVNTLVHRPGLRFRINIFSGFNIYSFHFLNFVSESHREHLS
jgi:hypothetical protein